MAGWVQDFKYERVTTGSMESILARAAEAEVAAMEALWAEQGSQSTNNDSSVETCLSSSPPSSVDSSRAGLA